MSVTSEPVREPDALAAKRDERRAAGVACAAHALHDGYTDLIYVMLPIWQKEFGLGYAELGLLRGLFSGTMAGFQIPSGLIAERVGTAPMLALGTALAGAGYCLAGASAGFGLLVMALFVGGLGASVQHPLGSSLMARAFARIALDEGARHLQFCGRYRQDDGARGRLTLAGRDVVAPGACSPRRSRCGCSGRDLCAHSALRCRYYSARGAGARDRQDSRRPVPLRVSGAALDRHARQRDPHGLPAVPAVPAHGQRRDATDHRACADARFCRRRSR